jgi:putative transcriptional regulator
MSNAFKEIKAGLREALAHANGRSPNTKVHTPHTVDVKALRARIGMTQEEFAAKFGVSTATLRHWERGDRQPHGPARVLLTVIDRNPTAVMRALTPD